jgi:hypothetical protein
LQAQGHLDAAFPYENEEQTSKRFRIAGLYLDVIRVAAELGAIVDGHSQRLLGPVPRGHFVADDGSIVELPWLGSVVEITSCFSRGTPFLAEVTDLSDEHFWAANQIFSAREHGRRWRWPDRGVR